MARTASFLGSALVVISVMLLLLLSNGARGQTPPLDIRYDDTLAVSISSSSVEAAGSSWLLTVEVAQLPRAVFDAIYQDIVKPVADASESTLCSMSVTISSRRARLSLVCPADEGVVARVRSVLIERYGHSAVSVIENKAVGLMSESVGVRPAGILTVQSGVSWNLDRIDARVNAPDGLYGYDDNGSGADVWTVDSGVLAAHMEFGGRATNERNTIDTIDRDCNGHGTHVAGIIAGTRYGVAKGAIIRACKAINCAGSGTIAAVLSCFDYIADMRSPTRATIVNLSLEIAADTSINTGVTNLVTVHGIAVVVAAGNHAALAAYYSPASASAAITVAACDRYDRMAAFSNFGSYVDMCAPGVDIISAYPTSTVSFGGMSGTSMASPCIAGAVAIRWSTVANKFAAALVMSYVIGNGTRNVVTNGRGTSPPLAYTRLGSPVAVALPAVQPPPPVRVPVNGPSPVAAPVKTTPIKAPATVPVNAPVANTPRTRRIPGFVAYAGASGVPHASGASVTMPVSVSIVVMVVLACFA